MIDSSSFPLNHPVKRLFRGLADRALTQSSISDKDILLYLADLLVDFIYIENLYRIRDQEGKRIEYVVDMLQRATEVRHSERKSYYKHIGDHTLFILGMFPEWLSYGRRMLSPSDYSDAGRWGYITASELEEDVENTVVFRKLAEKFERCVLSLNWVREYTTDPFYQYMFRQFGIT